MRLDFSESRVLAVVAHPDDAELLCAGTLARARAEGAAIGICVMCQGDKGQPAEAVDDLASVRLQEMQRAAEILGAEMFSGGIPDSRLQDDETSRAQLIGVLRTFRPSLVMAHSPYDYHVDHRATSALAESCSWLSASHGQPLPQEPLGEPPELWWMDTIGMQQFDPSFYIDVTEHAAVKEQMLMCHVSQLSRSNDASFGPLLELMRTQLAARGAQSGVAAAEAFCTHHSFKRTRAW